MSILAIVSGFSLSSQVKSLNFENTFQITFRQTGAGSDFSGTIVTVDGANFKVAALPVSFTWTALSTHTFIFQSPLLVQAAAKQYVWNSTTGLATAQSGSIVASSSGDVTGNYRSQYYLLVYSQYGTKGGEGWYFSGLAAYATLSVGEIDYKNGTRQWFTNWGGDASGTDFTQSDPLTMDRPQTAIAIWKAQHYLKVETDPSNVSIIPSEGWYNVGTNVSLASTSVQNYQFSHWDIDGVSQGEGVDPITVSMNITHTATAHYERTPPQATFTYSPLDSYVNTAISFNASASAAGGSNDTIVSYEWDFGDGTPIANETSFMTTHSFTQAKDYNVTLNVTNSRGAWSIASKALSILPPKGPTADFMWYPATPRTKQTVVFDASMSKPGYNGTHYVQIANCTWNFGDGNVTNFDNMTASHEYRSYGDYNVTLRVVDSNGLTANVTKTVRVRVIGLTGDVNGDGTVDIYDAIILAKSFGAQLDDPDWNPNADINNDGMVDIYDALMLAGNFGKTMP